MRKHLVIIPLLFFGLAVMSGCALGRKEWPSANKSEDSFSLSLIEGVRQEGCLMLQVAVKGAVHRLWRASVLYEAVGSDEGQGCAGCPFVPREAVHFTRDQEGFVMQGNILKLSICGLEPGTEYRFRVSGKSELSTMPLQYTDVYEAAP